jgi:NADH-quinone oxidoreductase subunit H
METTTNTAGHYAYAFAIILAQSFAVILPLLVSVAFIVYADRKIWAAVMLRRGPNVVGPFGVLQSFADFIKFAFKELIVPAGANKFIFFLAPMISLISALGAWAVVPFSPHWVVADINVGILYLFAVSSLGVYGIIMAGWASNSKYPFLGGLRSAAQMVSYEVSIGLVLVAVLLCVGSLNITDIVRAQEKLGLWFVIPHFPMFVIFFISALAETNRPPFDLPEAESELVAGHMVEYSSTGYLLFMMSEYVAIVLMCVMMSILFLGGWLPPLNMAPFTWIPGPLWLIGKALVMFFLFAMVKAMVPRYRYDQLMRLGWKVFLPFTLFWVVLTAGVLTAFNLAPK